MSARRILTAVATAGVAAVVAATTAGPAGAAIGGGSQGGEVSLRAVDVQVSGGAGDPLTGAGGTTISVSVPPKCWWGPFTGSADSSDAKAMQAWFDDMRSQMRGHAAGGYFELPTIDYVKSVTKTAKSTPQTWYQLNSQPGVNCAEEGFASSHGTWGDAYGGRGAGDLANEQVPMAYQAFATGSPLPPPLVDVEDVVTAVWDEAAAEIAGPDLGRNPTIQAAGGATLVNLPTWFWVQNVNEALAGDGVIELEVSVPGTPVRATLTSRTESVQITSYAGSTECTIPAAKTEWAPGSSEESACTIPFDRANTGGWDVTAQTTWTGSWQGTDRNGPVGGTLDTLTPWATVSVPVAESQALVNDVG
ncbi:hypothetical protein K8W59_12595 [Nocardioides rotundus]|uniref:hypothetical protein n=1 Tax=Nocardioides rotundus TaxID=1774216 RepID=UPI001CBF2048|nr:hypothetical protein [Nocardioides rotundus]UAL28697.1 hypothetical protein K8W59_12595 [Nocardioides rotundus]